MASAELVGVESGRRRRTRQQLFYRLCAFPAFTLTLLGGSVPLLLLLVQSLQDQKTGEWTLHYYVSSFTTSFITNTLISSIAMALGVAVVSVILGLPMAYLLARRTILRNILMPVITVPRMLPFVVVGYAMILLLAPVTGVRIRLLVGAGIIHTPLFILVDWPGQALAFGYSSLVVAIGILTGVFLS